MNSLERKEMINRYFLEEIIYNCDSPIRKNDRNTNKNESKYIKLEAPNLIDPNSFYFVNETKSCSLFDTKYFKKIIYFSKAILSKISLFNSLFLYYNKKYIKHKEQRKKELNEIVASANNDLKDNFKISITGIYAVYQEKKYTYLEKMQLYRNFILMNNARINQINDLCITRIKQI